jgi:hypothetical protein
MTSRIRIIERRSCAWHECVCHQRRGHNSASVHVILGRSARSLNRTHFKYLGNASTNQGLGNYQHNANAGRASRSGGQAQ